MPAYQHLIHAGEGAVAEAKEALMKALGAVDEFLALHGAGEGEYAVGPHYGWSMTASADQVGMLGGAYLPGDDGGAPGWRVRGIAPERRLRSPA